MRTLQDWIKDGKLIDQYSLPLRRCGKTNTIFCELLISLTEDVIQNESEETKQRIRENLSKTIETILNNNFT